MKLHYFVFPFLFFGFLHKAVAQEIATLEITMPQEPFASGIPVSTDLNALTYITDSLLVLVESVDGNEIPVNFQIEHEEGRKLVWMLDSKKPGNRIFKLLQRQAPKGGYLITSEILDGGIVLGNSSQPLLRYNYATLMPPEGIAEVFKRSGFIHPFWSPGGKELTRIQAPDHYHHYGLWNPWTRLEYEGKVVDLWNLGEKQGTVRFANFISRISGPVYGSFKVLHEHVIFEEAGEEVVLNEVQGVRIFQQENYQDSYIADISIDLNTATDHKVILKEYRYGGLGWRATEKWHRDNSEVITSDGRNRVDSDGSLARWCIVQGEIDEEYAAVLMMSFPTNYNHPEPLRIWPEDIYDRGDVFANFSPTKDKDWVLEPGKNYRLNYRFYVSDKKITAEEAERLWQYYAHPPNVNVILAK
ncbi:MAG TPA: PmoA family protein [Cyclobacteriaceae bacterium]|nr:PmoA family protein [Cyclobacteriaceae bacterium]